MSLEKHAMREFQLAGWVDKDGNWPDEMQKSICENVLAMLKTFSDGRHSGSTASYALGLFNVLVLLEPINALSGEDHEWNEVGDGIWQNNRCGRVFKGSDGKAYDIEGKVFKDCNGMCSTNNESKVFIEFPYTPKTEYILVESNNNES